LKFLLDTLINSDRLPGVIWGLFRAPTGKNENSSIKKLFFCLTKVDLVLHFILKCSKMITKHKLDYIYWFS